MKSDEVGGLEFRPLDRVLALFKSKSARTPIVRVKNGNIAKASDGSTRVIDANVYIFAKLGSFRSGSCK